MWGIQNPYTQQDRAHLGGPQYRIWTLGKSHVTGETPRKSAEKWPTLGRQSKMSPPDHWLKLTQMIVRHLYFHVLAASPTAKSYEGERLPQSWARSQFWGRFFKMFKFRFCCYYIVAHHSLMLNITFYRDPWPPARMEGQRTFFSFFVCWPPILAGGHGSR